MSRPSRRWPRALAAGALLAVIGLSLFLGGRHLWAEYRFRTAQQALARREFSRARSDLEVCLRAWPRNPAAHFLAARTAREAGFYDEAARRLDLCQRLEGPGADIALERALLRAQQGELSPELEDYLRAYREQHPEDAVMIFEALSQGYGQTYRVENARDCLTEWLQREPGCTRALLQRGWAQERLGQFALARDDYREAVRLEPGNDAAALRLAQVLVQVGQPADAAALFERLQRQQPGNPVVVVGLAQCRGKLGQFEEAEELLDALAAREPRDMNVLLERGRLAQQRGDAAAAEPWLRRAAEVAPQDYQVCYSLYLCLRQQGKDAEARAWQERAGRCQSDLLRLSDLTYQLQKRPYDASLRCAIGEVFLRNGERHEGELWLKSALQADPHYRPAHEALAGYYEENGKTTLAARHRRQAGAAEAPRGD